MSNLKILSGNHSHIGWDNSLKPVLTVVPGEEVVIEALEASGGQITADSGVEAVEKLDFSKVNPITGPVYVEGAEPGDALVVDLLGFEGSGWGWTAIIPGFGLLAEEFDRPALQIAKYDEKVVEFAPGIELPTRPFPGTIGVALAEPGTHSVVNPRETGGNMDTRNLGPGSRLYLPVQVEGALFSIGDTHAAQGDGEVCGTAVETGMKVHVKFDLIKKANLPRPQLEYEVVEPGEVGKYYTTTGIGPDLLEAAKNAVRDMVDYLVREYKLDAEFAYMLCSVAVDLKISEIVDVPHYLVSAHLPKSIFK
ncbi:MAG: acetamidase/formamidase family protein [Firmicutes bacterium]|nr:acetamidase/formamidase family protein [Bacillota bacterium]